MTDNPMLEPAYWRMRAEETRAKAEGLIISEHQREKLLKVAQEYDQLALRAEQWQRDMKPPVSEMVAQ